ncbi:brain protein I3-like isoform X1 [Portunus trituberculatus]|uniref:Membrane protein BRI3 n=1 Tax=Portunus trituberculatus TaxID=210409 RepID=A0A5B7CF59_PORTR|nr:brain protein I3-like isoform X1 [Portunus trituberculatus]XP_045134744.1 brain protein I3-like isoform X1 [Portunus trituberculatus]MPC08159.1 Brain protein I3 [Portunus trituberculatus]
MQQQPKYDQYSPPQGPPPPYNQAPIGFQGQGQMAYPAPPMQSSSSTTVVSAQPVVTGQPMLIVSGGNCPACRSGILQNEFTCCGICLGICFFPLGLLCCLLMRERKCSNCRASFGSS